MDPRGSEKSPTLGTGPPQRHGEGTSGCSPNPVTPLGLSSQLLMAQLLPRTGNHASELQLSVKMFLQDLKQIFQTTGNTNKPLSEAAVAALPFHRKQDPSWLCELPLSCKQPSQKPWHSHTSSITATLQGLVIMGVTRPKGTHQASCPCRPKNLLYPILRQLS